MFRIVTLLRCQLKSVAAFAVGWTVASAATLLILLLGIIVLPLDPRDKLSFSVSNLLWNFLVQLIAGISYAAVLSRLAWPQWPVRRRRVWLATAGLGWSLGFMIEIAILLLIQRWYSIRIAKFVFPSMVPHPELATLAASMAFALTLARAQWPVIRVERDALLWSTVTITSVLLGWLFMWWQLLWYVLYRLYFQGYL